MLGITLHKLLKSFNEWRSTRQLISLAKRTSFAAIKPEAIGQLLNKINSSSLFTHGTLNTSNSRVVCERTVRIALLAVWELSSREEKRKNPLRFKWHRVMAQVNQMYASLESGAMRRVSNG